MTPEPINEIARAIQLALGPAFLLTGTAGLLNVMAGRLSRIIDRGRVLAEDRTIGNIDRDAVNLELRDLERRRYLTSVAITACTIAALLVCMVIASLFLEAMLLAPLNGFIGVLFTAATVALVVGLAFFLREVHLATQTIRIPKPEPDE
ncbi:MAG: DUF2721 domain-containing protein [Gammaproteobacteria bacterium]